MSLIHTADNVLSFIIKSMLGSIILFASVLLFTNVVMRYLFLAPIFWAEELARYLMVWLIFLGASQVAGVEGHISVNIITRILGTRGNLYLSKLGNLFSLIFCVALTYYSWKHTMRVCNAQQVTAALDLPMWWAYLAVPAGSALMSLRYAFQLFGYKGKGAAR
ncbi:TRAP transporter small permease [Maridesulfovibrio sp.]|uniref:TRAP transporter small permease n=1 Tax=unclassified Maridesulfovibrio TaxID=2794999 RepID=UPI003B00CE98